MINAYKYNMGCAIIVSKRTASSQDFTTEKSKSSQFQFKFKSDKKLNIKFYKLETIKEEMHNDEFSFQT